MASGDPRTYADMATPAGLREIARYADGVGPSKDYIVPRDAAGNSLPPTASSTTPTTPACWSTPTRSATRTASCRSSCARRLRPGRVRQRDRRVRAVLRARRGRPLLRQRRHRRSRPRRRQARRRRGTVARPGDPAVRRLPARTALWRARQPGQRRDAALPEPAAPRLLGGPRWAGGDLLRDAGQRLRREGELGRLPAAAVPDQASFQDGLRWERHRRRARLRAAARPGQPRELPRSRGPTGC